MTIKKVPCKGMCIVHADDGDAVEAIGAFTDELNADRAIRLLSDVLKDLGVKVEVAGDDNQAKK